MLDMIAWGEACMEDRVMLYGVIAWDEACVED